MFALSFMIIEHLRFSAHSLLVQLFCPQIVQYMLIGQCSMRGHTCMLTELRNLCRGRKDKSWTTGETIGHQKGKEHQRWLRRNRCCLHQTRAGQLLIAGLISDCCVGSDVGSDVESEVGSNVGSDVGSDVLTWLDSHRDLWLQVTDKLTTISDSGDASTSNKLAKLGDAIAISKSETMNDSFTAVHWLTDWQG